MAKLAEHWVEIGARLDKFNAGMAQVEGRMARVGKTMTAAGKKMTRYITLPLVALGVLAVKAGADFEYAMTNAWAVTGEGETALASMTAKAREMGATTVFSAKQAGDAMYYMASAGWDSKKMAEAIKPTLHLAAATQSDLAFATEAVIASMNQFQITTKDTGRVTNVFAAAIMGSQATLEKLKLSMTYVGPIAHSLGYEIEETTAALMGLYNAGFEASTAGTALRMALAKLTLGTGATREGLADLGLKIGDVNPEIYSMAEIIRKLEERGATATHILKIFAVRAGPAMASLIAQGADALDKFEKEITDTNRAAEMADKQLDTFMGSFKLLTSIINEASIQIFAVLGPIIRDLIDKKIRPAIVAFTELTEGKKKLILKIAGLVAALGPILLIFGALTTTIIPAVITGIMGLATAMVFLATNPAGMVLVAIGAIVAILLKLRWEQYKTAKEMEKFDDAGKASARHVKRAIELAGLTEKEYIKLRKAYGGNTQELMKAIKAGEHGKDLQFALITLLKEERKKRKELRDEQAAARKIEEDARKRIRDMNEDMKNQLELLEKAKTKAKEWAEVEIELGITSIEAKKKRIEELNERLKTLEKKQKDNIYTASDYAKAVKATKDEIDELNKSLEDAKKKTEAWAKLQAALGIFTIEEKKKKIKELEESLKLLNEKYETGKITLFDYTEGSNKLREELDRVKESLSDVKGENEAWIKLQEELGIITIKESAKRAEELEEKLKLLKEQYDAGTISLDAYVEALKKLRGEMGEVAATFKEKFLEIADATANLISQIGNLGQVKLANQIIALDEATNAEREGLDERYEAEKEAIENSLMSEEEKEEALEELEKEKYDAFAKLDEDYEKKKNEIAKKAFESHKKISLVIAAIDIASAIIEALPNFILAGLAAAAGAVQLAVISAAKFPSLQEGGLIPRPMPVMAGHGPRGEIIASPAKLAEIISKEMPRVASPEPAFAPAVIQPIVNIYAQTLDRDTIREAGELLKREIDYQYGRIK